MNYVFVPLWKDKERDGNKKPGKKQIKTKENK
jgi:hypothetical protein